MWTLSGWHYGIGQICNLLGLPDDHTAVFTMFTREWFYKSAITIWECRIVKCDELRGDMVDLFEKKRFCYFVISSKGANALLCMVTCVVWVTKTLWSSLSLRYQGAQIDRCCRGWHRRIQSSKFMTSCHFLTDIIAKRAILLRSISEKSWMCSRYWTGHNTLPSGTVAGINVGVILRSPTGIPKCFFLKWLGPTFFANVGNIINFDFL